MMMFKRIYNLNEDTCLRRKRIIFEEILIHRDRLSEQTPLR